MRGSRLLSLGEAAGNDFWLRTEAGLSLFAPQESELKTFIPTSDPINILYQKGKDSLWYAVANKLFRQVVGGEISVNRAPIAIFENPINCMKQTGLSTLWVGLNGYGGDQSGLLRLNSDGRVLKTYHASDGRLVSVVELFEDRSGQLWVGANGGLFHYDPGQDQMAIILEEAVTTIVENQSGSFWLGTGKGLWLYDPEKGDVEIFTNKVNLASNTVGHIVKDKKEALWLWTPAGISKFLPNSREFQHFERNSDLFLKLPVGAYKSTVVTSQEGDIFFITERGINRLISEEIMELRTPPKITITRLVVSQDTISLLYQDVKSLEFPYDQNDLMLEFVGLHYSNPAENRYAYMLENSDNSWISTPTDRRARYNNLDPGQYTFRVKAASSEGIWSEESRLKIKILPPWWQTGWAYLLFGSTVLAVIMGIYRLLLKRQLAVAETLRLKELDAIKTKLYTNITHEFRTPLTVILGMVDQVRTNPSDWLKKGTETISRNADHLLKLVNQMLDLNKLESGKLALHPICSDIIGFLRYLIESFHSFAESKDIHLHFLSKHTEFEMDFDPERIQDVLSNLLSNAVKYTPAGGDVYVTVTADHDRQLAIEVKDTGFGIGEEELPHIFDRFYQADASSTRRGEGTGVGLALTKELVVLMGGAIRVNSVPEQGTTFTVLIPVSRQAARSEVVITGISSGWKQAEVAPDSLPSLSDNISANVDLPIVLVIEDNADVVQYIASVLDQRYQLQIARNGREGIDRALEQTPDLIISDVMMPEKDGFEVCNTLKKDPRTSHIPIILLTAKADIASKLSGLKKGADAYLSKPFDKEELLIRLQKLLESREKLRHYYLSLASSDNQYTLTETTIEEKLENEFVRQVRETIEAHIAEPGFTVDELCRKIGMSHSQLHRKLVALTGLSFSKLTRSLRMNRAKELLKNQELTIAAVAYDAGFSDPDYFHRVFKKEVGMTPTAFRKGT